MKKFLVIISLLFSGVAIADTINLKWLNDDGTIYEESTCVVNNNLNIPSTPPTKRGHTFIGWEMVPYTQVEYMTSTGTQYIDTGIVFNDGSLRFQALFYVEQILSGENDFIGTLTNSGSSDGFCCGTYQAGTFFLYSRPVNVHMSNIQTGVWYDIVGEFNNRTMSLYINGSLVDYGTRNYFYSSEHIILFMGGPGYLPLNTHQKLGSIKIWHTETLVRDFIPVLDADNVPCMYDRVEGKFYYNQGTGDFIAGLVVGSSGGN